MKTLLLTLLLISGKLCADPINTSIHYQEALSNFHYSQEPEDRDEWNRYDITEEFVGDCEDFALSLQEAVRGGNVYYVFLGNDVKKPHAVLIKDGVVWDFLGVQDLEEYQKENTVMAVVLDYDSKEYQVVKSVK